MPFHFVGANDAGSGTAVLLELARILAESAGERPVTYRLLFLDGEEAVYDWNEGQDNTYGSRYHVAQLQEDPDLLKRVAACVLLDMVGDAKLQLYTESQSDSQLLNIIFEVARRNQLGRYVGGPRRHINDDHVPFLEARIPAVNLIDFGYGPRSSSTSGGAWWHTEEDTLDKLSPDSLHVVGRIVLWSLPELETWALNQP